VKTGLFATFRKNPERLVVTHILVDLMAGARRPGAERLGVLPRNHISGDFLAPLKRRSEIAL